MAKRTKVTKREIDLATGVVLGHIIYDAMSDLTRMIIADELRWITIHPNGKGAKLSNGEEDVKGKPVLIDTETGKIVGGAIPQSLHGVRLQSKEEREKNGSKSFKDIIKEGKEKQSLQPNNNHDLQTSNSENQADQLAKLKAPVRNFRSDIIKQLGDDVYTSVPYMSAPSFNRKSLELSSKALDPSIDKWSSATGLSFDSKDEQKAFLDLERQVYAFKGAHMLSSNWKSTRRSLHQDYTMEQQSLDEGLALEKRYKSVLKSQVKQQQPQLTESLQGSANQITNITNSLSKCLAGLDEKERDRNSYVLQANIHTALKTFAPGLVDVAKQVSQIKSLELYRDSQDLDVSILSQSTVNYLQASVNLAVVKAMQLRKEELKDALDVDAAHLSNLEKQCKAQYKQAKAHICADYNTLRPRDAVITDMNVAKSQKLGASSYMPQNLAGQPKGRAMDFEQANQGRANPNFKTDVKCRDSLHGEVNPYTINCQSCVVANEMRFRGYQVSAQPNVEGKNRCNELSHNVSSIWRDPETGGSPTVIALDSVHELKALVHTNERYHLFWGWRNRDSGHIVTVHRDTNGQEPVIYDPQTGETRSIGDFVRKYGDSTEKLKAYRVDNCEIVEDLANGVLTSDKEGVMFGLKPTL